MTGQLIIFYEGDEPEHFLKGIFEFPQVLPVLAERSEELKKLGEERNRSVLFMGDEEARVFFGPDFEFHYASSGESPKAIAAKIKQDFAVMLFIGANHGDPVNVGRSIDGATAASIISYEVLKLLRRF